MATNVSGFQRPQRLRVDKGRRSWTTREEEVLLAGFKEIRVQGWKSDNGFRPGYLQILEGFMVKAFPRTNIKATPHINSRLHTWKKNYGSLTTMLSKTGIRLDHKTKMIEATDEVWDAHVKVDPNFRLMRYKTWPYYEAWCEIFGKDRANGAGAEDVGEASNNPSGVPIDDAQLDKAQDDELNGIFAGWTDEHEPSSLLDKLESSSTTTKKTASRKRRNGDSTDAISESVMKFCNEASKRLGAIAERIGYEVDFSVARKQVFQYVDRISDFTLQQKLQVTKLLGQSTEDLEIFSGLPDEAKEEWTKMKLAGSL